MYAKIGLTLLAVSLIAVLTLGGFAHAIVPHEHGDENRGQQSVLWSDLHAVLGGAQRKMLVAVTGTLFLLLLFSIARYAEKALLLARRRERRHIRSLDPIDGELLRHGVMPHRAFR